MKGAPFASISPVRISFQRSQSQDRGQDRGGPGASGATPPLPDPDARGSSRPGTAASGAPGSSDGPSRRVHRLLQALAGLVPATEGGGGAVGEVLEAVVGPATDTSGAAVLSFREQVCPGTRAFLWGSCFL